MLILLLLYLLIYLYLPTHTKRPRLMNFYSDHPYYLFLIPAFLIHAMGLHKNQGSKDVPGLPLHKDDLGIQQIDEVEDRFGSPESKFKSRSEVIDVSSSEEEIKLLVKRLIARMEDPSLARSLSRENVELWVLGNEMADKFKALREIFDWENEERNNKGIQIGILSSYTRHYTPSVIYCYRN